MKSLTAATLDALLNKNIFSEFLQTINATPVKSIISKNCNIGIFPSKCIYPTGIRINENRKSFIKTNLIEYLFFGMISKLVWDQASNTNVHHKKDKNNNYS